MSRSHHPRSTASVPATFHDQLIIDRHHAVLASTNAEVRRRLAQVSADDAYTWNVFRSLRQVDAGVWLPELFRFAFPDQPAPKAHHAQVRVWRALRPPPALALLGDDLAHPMDVVIECVDWVWCIESRADLDGLGKSAAARPDRDGVLRAIDVGSWHAGARTFYYSLLLPAALRESAAAKLVHEYANPDHVRQSLKAHRPDGIANLGGVSLLSRDHVADVLRDVSTDAPRAEERGYAQRVVAWLDAT